MSQIVWLSSDDPPGAFPDVGRALRDPDGLLAAGGDLNPDRLIYAYTHGIFPWFEEGQPPLWWSPDPRCILLPDQLRCSRRLRQYMRQSTMTISMNRDFPAVIRACRAEREYVTGTWITNDMERAYTKLFDLGWAHSIEVWDGDELAGGLYGIAIGKAFFGESMFSKEPNTSKMAMAALCQLLLKRHFELLDCQVISPHLQSLGAIQIGRKDFVQRLVHACEPPVKTDDWPQEKIALQVFADG